MPKQRSSRANLPTDQPLPQLVLDEPKPDSVVQDNQNVHPDIVSSDTPTIPDSQPIPLPSTVQDLILPDVHNLIGDQEPDSSFIHRYNLRQAPRVIRTTKTQRKAKAQLHQQIQLDPDMITCHTNLTRDDIAEAQRNDKFCSEIILFLH